MRDKGQGVRADEQARKDGVVVEEAGEVLVIVKHCFFFRDYDRVRPVLKKLVYIK